MKKIICFILAAVMLLSLAACGSGSGSGGNNSPVGSGGNGDSGISGGYYLGELKLSLGTPEKTLNPEDVYSKLTYTPEMFYGKYRILGGEGGISNYKGQMDYIDYTPDKYVEKITAIPYQIEAGPNTLLHKVNNIKEHSWVRAYFQSDSGNLVSAIFAYEISGKKITLTYLDEFKVDEERNVITYRLGDFKLEYDFSFSGRDLTLSAGGKSVTMSTGLEVYEDTTRLYAENYLSAGSATIDNIDYISFLYSGDINRLTFEDKDGNSFYGNCVANMGDTGLFTFMIPWETGAKTYQYVYFLCDNDGIILTDGENTYYFNDTYGSRYKNNLGSNLTVEDAGKLENMQEDKLEDIVEKKEDLFAELEKAFKDEGINVVVNRETGEIAMDATVLFGGDSAEVTAAGKDLLNKFIDVYTSIIFSEKYKGFVEKTMVEGHTAPVAGTTYEDGLPLSEQRAANVKSYCLSSETGISADYITALSGAMETIGYSCGKPIYAEDGSVDMAACRRVSFKFIINIDG